MKTLKIGFIGAGNMNSAIIGGLVNSGYEVNAIMASDPNRDKLKQLQKTYKILIHEANTKVAKFADILIIGVKPHYVSDICLEVAKECDNTLIISIAAGTRVEQIAQHFPTTQAIIRIMPNTPCLIAEGAIGIFKNDNVSAEQHQMTEHIFSTTGIVEWITDEEQMDIVTALSGSGPAYFFYIAEAMLTAAKQQGMEQKQAESLVFQTMKGAAAMLKQSDLSAAELRTNVTSPGGTTAAALTVLNDQGVADHLQQAIDAAVIRGQELSKS